MADVIEVIIADDHPLFRLGVKHAVESDDRYKVVAEADAEAGSQGKPPAFAVRSEAQGGFVDGFRFSTCSLPGKQVEKYWMAAMNLLLQWCDIRIHVDYTHDFTHRR